MTSLHRVGKACGLLLSHGLGPAVLPLGPPAGTDGQPVDLRRSAVPSVLLVAPGCFPGRGHGTGALVGAVTSARVRGCEKGSQCGERNWDGHERSLARERA